MVRSRLALLLLTLLFVGSPTKGQERTPICLDSQSPITRSNASKVIRLAAVEYDGQIFEVVWSSSDGDTIAVIGTSGIWLYNVCDLEAGPHILGYQEGEFITSVTNSPDGLTLISWQPRISTPSNPGGAYLWDALTGVRLLTLQDRPYEATTKTYYNPDATVLAVGGEDRPGRIWLWDAATGKRIATFGDHERWINHLVFSPDGGVLASCGLDGMVHLWSVDVANSDVGDRIGVVDVPGHVTALAYSPDGAIFASGSWDRTVRFWDAVTYDELATLETGALVFDIAFGRDGTVLASGTGVETGSEIGHDGNTLQLWDVTTRERLVVLTGHTSAVGSIAFNPLGTMILTGQINGGVVYLWGIPPSG